MKVLMLICVTLIFSTFSHAQSECSQYYPFAQGTLTEITSYNRKGKIAAISTYTVLANEDNLATISYKLTDSEGDVISESNFDMECTGDRIEIDIQSMLSPELAIQYADMETTVTGADIIVPNNLEVGDDLPDATMEVKMGMSGINLSMSIMMLNRKVVAEETVTTPAGTFDCLVIEYTSKLKMGFERISIAKQWIAKDVGIVMQEDYNQKGKVTSSTKLTKIKR